ncbi:MAG: hypothetical protein MJ233_03920 [Mycoplasmoidaceae bacterium]|nr:hypothetical protein [Mycoplasmoidaceae bacterium]
MCNLFVILLPLLLIVDPTRMAARSLAPIGVMSSLMVLLVIIPMQDYNSFTIQELILGSVKTFQFDFGSIKIHSLFYSTHLINLLISIGVILATPRYG